MRDISRFAKEYAKLAAPVVAGDIAADISAKLAQSFQQLPIQGPFAKIVLSLALAGASYFVKEQQSKQALSIASAVSLWAGVKELLRERNIYPLSSHESISLQVEPEVITVPAMEEAEREKVEVYEEKSLVEVA